MNLPFGNIPLRAMVLLFATGFAGTLNGQKIIPAPEDLYQEASEYIMAGDYQEALPVLLNLKEKGYNGANISFKIGDCYLNLKGQKIKAIPFLKEASQNISKTYSGISLDEGVAPLKSLLYLAISYRLRYDFSNALLYFTAYLDSLDDKDIENRSLVQYHIARCLNAGELIASPARFISDTLPADINTQFSNFNPLVSADEKQLFYIDQLKFYDAIMHVVKTDSAWQKPDNMTSGIGSDGDHLVTGVSADCTELLLSAYDPYLSGELFIAEYRNDLWNKIRKLNGNINTRFNETHASFSPDGQYLYFTSDRKGGYGGLDIYRSQRKDQDWGVAENLGPIINSPYNEETPFITTDGKALFFSSQGHYNMGGYDIFMSSLDQDGKWMPPVNLGYPINTTDDDLFYFPLGSGKVAYQARFAANSSQNDIIRYNIISYGNPYRYKLSGKVSLQADPGYEPGNISVSFIDNQAKDTLSHQKLNSDCAFSQKLPAGSFTVEFSEKDNMLLSKILEIPAGFPQDELVLNANLTIRHKETRDTLFLKDILFGFSKSRLEDPYFAFLDKLVEFMAVYSDLKVSVNGYADSRGNENYNKKLSLTRANAVAGYLNRDKSLSGRIMVKAFGEQNPVALNENPDGSDNPVGRSFNRRVELVFDHVPDGLDLSKLNMIPLELRIR
jgi:outer membrane protein OmpA-like peptidoglycan-associated protein